MAYTGIGNLNYGNTISYIKHLMNSSQTDWKIRNNLIKPISSQYFEETFWLWYHTLNKNDDIIHSLNIPLYFGSA